MVFVLVFSPLQIVNASEVLTLDQCIQRSLEKNPAVLASVERKVQAEWNKKAAYRNFFPMLNMDYSYTYFKDEQTINTTFPGIGQVSILKHDNFMMGLHIDQPLFTGFRILETYNLADLGLQEAVAGAELASLEIIYQTSAAYYDLLKFIQLQKVKDDEVAMLTSHLRDAQSFFDHEKIPLNDLLQSKVHLANAEQGARIAATMTELSQSRLATIMKEPLDQSLQVSETIHTAPFQLSLAAVTQKALDTRPELKQANYALEASQKQIRLTKSDYYPTVALQATHNRYGGDALVDGSGISDLQTEDESLIGVYATWKLMDWGQRGYRVNRAEAASREVEQRLVGVMDAVALEVKTNFDQAATAFTNIEPAKLAVEQAIENLKMNELRYRNELSTVTDVLDARTLLTETEFNLYTATYDYQTWLAGLARAAGVQDWEELQE
jgi:outer membrane protein TolC